jgi:hypothetical protein
MAGFKIQIKVGVIPSALYPRWKAFQMNRMFRFFSKRSVNANSFVMEDIPVSEVQEKQRETASTHALMCEALLDKKFYLETYSDLATAGVDPLEHYIECGHAEGRYPLSVYSATAATKISSALKHNPSDRMALALHVAIELACGDLDRALAAVAIDTNSYMDQPPQAYLTNPFEQAALLILSRWIRFESTQRIGDVERLISKLRKRFPSSLLLSSLHAIALFESGQLKSASRVFEINPDLEGISIDLANICRHALGQILDSETVGARYVPDNGLLLLDSAFPSTISSFRYGEFSTYLTTIENSVIQIRPDRNLIRFGESNSLETQINAFSKKSGVSHDRVRRFESDIIGNPKVVYCVFLSLADLFFTQIGISSAEHFIFTLYPGGGFAPNDQRSDLALRQLCDNPKVSKIITTQITSYRYLIDNGFCNPDRILHIFGGIIPQLYSETPPPPRPINQSAINICFVAQRYSAIGAEKGYDVYAEVVKKFANNPSITFHVVGGFDASVIDLGDASNVTFYGTRPASFFPEFYASMDAILSPNIQVSALDPSQPAIFDGFPTTCVVEAGLQGVAMFLTDFQSMNQHLDGTPIFSPEEMQIINRDCETICGKLQHYIDDREALHQLGQAGRLAIHREFSFERQMVPRIELLKSYLEA